MVIPICRSKWLLLVFGTVSVLGFTPFRLPWILLVTYSVLVSTFKGASNKEGIVGGFIFGLAQFLIGLHWMFGIGDEFDDDYRLSIRIILVAIILILAAIIALVGFILTLIPKDRRNNPLWFCVLVPTVFCLTEWIRSRLFTGFTWFQIGFEFVDSGFSTVLPATGSLGLSFCVYVIIGCICFIASNYRSKKAWLVSLGSMSSLGLIGFGLSHVQWTQPMPEQAIDAQLIHDSFGLSDKGSRAKAIDRISLYQHLASLDPKPDLSVWPESSVSHDYSEIKRFLTAKFNSLELQGTTVLLGAYVQENGRTYNSILESSQESIQYTKQHLIPFGEYTPRWTLPFASWLPSFAMDNLEVDGEKSTAIDFRNLKLAPSICFEILFGDELRQHAGEANLQIHLSDLGWFESSWVASYLLNVARIRVLETQKPMIYVTNHGYSAFINQLGVIEKKRFGKGPVALAHEVIPYQGKTWYALWGSLPIVVSFFILFIFSFCTLSLETFPLNLKTALSGVRQ